MGSHFDNVCGMEIVLGNGDVIRTGDGSLEGGAADRANWHVTKYSFGPALDGLFTQSNYGIVTRMGMWLMQQPAVMRCFFFTYEVEADIARIVDRIRPLKAGDLVATMIRATSNLYLLSPQEPCPDYAATGGAAPLSKASRMALRRHHGLGA